jgi:hypothetical protein
MQLTTNMVRDEDDPFDTDTDGIFLSDTGSPAKITQHIAAEFNGICLESLLFCAIMAGLVLPFITGFYRYIGCD